MAGTKTVELRVLGEGLGAEIGAACFIEIGRSSYVPIHDHRGSLVKLQGQHPLSGHQRLRKKVWLGLNGNLISDGEYSCAPHLTLVSQT